MEKHSRSGIAVRSWIPWAIAGALAIGWAAREAARAGERAELVRSATITLDRVVMEDFKAGDKSVGKAGAYLSGDTPASTKFITGRFVLEPGQTPHAPHTHVEEEVMIVESGTGEIFCDGNTTNVGPGSVMYTTPNAPHGIVNNGPKPLVFYFVKWAGKPAS
jgi:mannose-6-phosphate isomerase-like protein (cupin superfamily)